MTPRQGTLSGAVAAAGLGGRGGGGFPAARKLDAARSSHARLIVNACDGEIGAAKDRWVLDHRTAELQHGIDLIRAWSGGLPPLLAIHASSLRAGDPDHPTFTPARRAALDELAAAGTDVLTVPDRYVASEASAIAAAAAGADARPVHHSRPLTQRRRLGEPAITTGRDRGRVTVPPTLVLNAETVWRIAQIAEHGPEWFRSLGTPSAPGPQLFSVAWNGIVSVFDSTAGVRLTELLAGAGAPVSNTSIGGLGGVWANPTEAAAAVLSPEGLARLGGIPEAGAGPTVRCGRPPSGVGSGAITVLPPDRCPVSKIAAWLRYAARQSARQCGPCMFGLDSLASHWSGLSTGDTTLPRLQTLLAEIDGRGACGFPDGVAAMTRSALRAFPDEIARHHRGRCAAEAAAPARAIFHEARP
ncbi:NADH-ubiquinone oxidoreductase-F iron-sulfur binding region domain-containing protein [Brevibacterium daeguense]|uniref:NADH-ubiquinone oxidoreductase-F iron-sulfur binding region domain-containing protein n=1 Tax=Brevibacterium daeguense TaxID=909936 RepID=A0ABP8EGA7_9MICO|nr:NADH-ubiquinone oxidoreductase-F iron-sulfur binding region domain-containing protein [Brevibacterium daeguense]